MKIRDILWDTDGERIDNLPKEATVEDVAEEDAANYLSDTYGFCVISYYME